jgi:hypothetical protein
MKEEAKTLLDSGDHAYGADANGLVWAYAFAPGLPAEPLAPEAIGRFVADVAACRPGRMTARDSSGCIS